MVVPFRNNNNIEIQKFIYIWLVDFIIIIIIFIIIIIL